MKKSKALQFFDRFSLFFALIIIFVFLAASTPVFLRPRNLLNILNQASLNMIIAIGMTFPMLLRGVDLSVGSVVALTSCLSAPLFLSGNIFHMIIGIVAAMLLGLICGAINGMGVAYLKLSPFLATFGMMYAARGLALFHLRGTVVNKFDAKFLFIGQGNLLGLPMPVVIAVVLMLIMGFVLKKTIIGRKVYSVGSNESAALYSGISVKKTTIFAFAMSGLFAAIAGIVYISRLDAAEPIIGEVFATQAIAAAAIGRTSFSGGVGNVFGTAVGALILTMIMNGLNIHMVPVSWLHFATGIIILMAVLMDRKSVRIEKE